jgi:cation:H+ antiporter
MHWPSWLADIGRQMQKGWMLLGVLDPYFSLALFVGASFLMIWRLGAMERKGLEGTVLGTLVMPYASGLSNLIFAYIMGRYSGNGKLVLENCLVNNTTNLTLLIGLPAMIWGLNIFPGKRSDGFGGGPHKAHRLNYLSLLLTLLAVVFFTGALWALSRDQVLDFSDGLVLVGLFVFWQIFHVFDVLKHNIQRGRVLNWTMWVDFFWVMAGAASVFGAIERLVEWIPKTGSGWLVFENLGWLSGILMVLPNALLAIYYAKSKRADIVYSSQVGDGHICIPMCIGVFALFAQIEIPAYFNLGVITIMGACMVHFLCVAILGRLPRIVGLICTISYIYFFYTGLIH